MEYFFMTDKLSHLKSLKDDLKTDFAKNKSRYYFILGIGCLFVFLITILYLVLNQKPDPKIIYPERLKLAPDSLNVIDVLNADNKGNDVESQIGEEEYQTYLGIDNGKNGELIAKELGDAQIEQKSIDELVQEHEYQTKELGGITSVNDLIARDTKAVVYPEIRATILKNLGLSESQYQELKADYEFKNGMIAREQLSEAEKESLRKADEASHHHHGHDHDEHDHEHNHSHDHNHNHEHHDHDHDHDH